MISFKKKSNEHKQTLILDTSGIIDGRIIAVAKAGFVPETIMVPQFVVAELQHLADVGDSQKRERARFGLDVIRELQDLRRSNVVVAREQFPKIKEVDDKLIALAKQYSGYLYTTDFNLNKVAQIEGIIVLNINELAQALRPPRLPGERVDLKITQAGQDKTQGVGFLEDGTMVVVEGAGRLINQKVQVQFSRILQTHAGKMMFAVLVAKQPQAPMVAVKKPFVKAPPAPIVRMNGVNPNQNQQPRPSRPNPAALPRMQPNVAPKAPGAQRQQPQQPQQQTWHSTRNRRRTPEDSLLAAIEQQRQQ